jgi:CRP-like cAMP-binding protein
MDSRELGKLAFFDGLILADLELLGPYFTSRSFTAGTTIFEQGDEAVYLYLVAKGEVVIRYKPEDGPLMTVTHIRSGGVFGDGQFGVYFRGRQCNGLRSLSHSWCAVAHVV